MDELASLQAVHVALGALGHADLSELRQRTGLAEGQIRKYLDELVETDRAAKVDGGGWEIRTPKLPAESSHWVTDFRRRLAAGQLPPLDDHPGVHSLIGAKDCLEFHWQAWQEAECEAVMLDRPPYIGGLPMPDEGEPDNPEMAAVRRGISLRAVYSPGFRHLSRLWYMRKAVEARMPLRIGPVWTKLTIIDQRLAFMPTLRSYEVPDTCTATIIRDPALIQILLEVFEFTWEFGQPIPTVFAAETSERRGELIALLLAGVTDAVIARELGVTERTVRRWVKDLHTFTGTETRLQLGAALTAHQDSVERHAAGDVSLRDDDYF